MRTIVDLYDKVPRKYHAYGFFYLAMVQVD
jgi:hypothetical protein